MLAAAVALKGGQALEEREGFKAMGSKSHFCSRQTHGV